MNTLGNAAPLADAPTTATVLGSNSGLNRSITLSLISLNP
jgi:hypothetical protein